MTREVHEVVLPTIQEALSTWRAAERRWEATSPSDPAYRQAAIDVIAAWLTYQTIAEDIEFGSFVMVADEDHRYVAVSDGVRDALGYQPAALLGRRIEDIAASDVAETTQADWDRFLVEGRQDGEFGLVAADGRDVRVRFQARAHYPIAGYHTSRLRPLASSDEPGSTPRPAPPTVS